MDSDDRNGGHDHGVYDATDAKNAAPGVFTVSLTFRIFFPDYGNIPVVFGSFA